MYPHGEQYEQMIVAISENKESKNVDAEKLLNLKSENQQPKKWGLIGTITGGFTVLIGAAATKSIDNDDLIPLFSSIGIGMIVGWLTGVYVQQAWSDKITKAVNNNQEVNDNGQSTTPIQIKCV